uniref:Uncharacterized protein n=1 Tax=Ananas comosus var. bracteatus TaxID=296719 RepID=A0A6V7QSB0_ANACO
MGRAAADADAPGAPPRGGGASTQRCAAASAPGLAVALPSAVISCAALSLPLSVASLHSLSLKLGLLPSADPYLLSSLLSAYSRLSLLPLPTASSTPPPTPPHTPRPPPSSPPITPSSPATPSTTSPPLPSSSSAASASPPPLLRLRHPPRPR